MKTGKMNAKVEKRDMVRTPRRLRVIGKR